MTAPSSKLDPGAVIGEAFRIYGQQASVLLPAAFALYAVQLLAVLALTSSVVGSVILSLVTAVLGTLYTGAVVQLVVDVQDGKRDSSLSELVSSVTPVLVPLILVSLLAGLLVVLGLVLLIVPGLIVMTLLAVVGPVTVRERPGVIAALSRSKALVTGSGWQVFAVILFVFALSIGVGSVTSGLGGGAGTTGGAIVRWIGSALLAPASALATAVMYLRLLDVRGEAQPAAEPAPLSSL